MKKFISYAALFTLMLSLVGAIGVDTANATVSGGAVTGNTATDLIVNTANADYNVVFDTDVAGNATTITVTFPATFTITDGALGAAAVQSCLGTSANICVNGADVAVSAVAGSAAGRTIIPTIGATNLSTGPGVSFRIITGVANPAVAGTTGTFTITSNAGGEVAQAGIAGVLITPAAITDLTCYSSSSTVGTIWLSWTTPAGATDVYTAKRSPSNIDAGNFNAATTISQVWPTGTVGQLQQQLVNILTAHNTYFFNLKAGGANSSIAPISNTVYCVAPAGASGTGGTSDSKAPVSAITTPGDKGGVLAGHPYTIKGTSSDTGGSSVKMVELSFDGGITWMTMTPKTSTGTGFDWEHVWALPGVGSYNLKTRATDYVGNVEVPGAGITAIVATTLPSFTVDLGGNTTATPTTPTTPSNTAQIQAQIDVLRAQLIVLLQQLLAMLQAQLHP